MKISQLPIDGAYLIEMEPHHDARGYFARFFDKEIFEDHGLVSEFLQMSVSFNKEKGQIRGMHFQDDPHGETKIVRCSKGRIYDVILDVRPDSPTYQQWYGTELSRENMKMFYIPTGCAHGYKTLEENTELFYMMDQVYVPDAAREIDYRTYGIFK